MSYLTKFYNTEELYRVTQNVFFEYCYKNIDPQSLRDEVGAFGAHADGGFGANIERKLIEHHQVSPALAKMALTTGFRFDDGKDHLRARGVYVD